MSDSKLTPAEVAELERIRFFGERETRRTEQANALRREMASATAEAPKHEPTEAEKAKAEATAAFFKKPERKP